MLRCNHSEIWYFLLKLSFQKSREMFIRVQLHTASFGTLTNKSNQKTVKVKKSKNETNQHIISSRILLSV